MTDSTMAKRKNDKNKEQKLEHQTKIQKWNNKQTNKQTMVDNILHRTLMIEQHVPQ